MTSPIKVGDLVRVTRVMSSLRAEAGAVYECEPITPPELMHTTPEGLSTASAEWASGVIQRAIKARNEAEAEAARLRDLLGEAESLARVNARLAAEVKRDRDEVWARAQGYAADLRVIGANIAGIWVPDDGVTRTPCERTVHGIVTLRNDLAEALLRIDVLTERCPSVAGGEQCAEAAGHTTAHRTEVYAAREREEALAEAVRLRTLLDEALGSPCAQVRWQEREADLLGKLAKAEASWKVAWEGMRDSRDEAEASRDRWRSHWITAIGERDALRAQLDRLSEAAGVVVRESGFSEGEAVVDGNHVAALAAARIEREPNGYDPGARRAPTGQGECGASALPEPAPEPSTPEKT